LTRQTTLIVGGSLSAAVLITSVMYKLGAAEGGASKERVQHKQRLEEQLDPQTASLPVTIAMQFLGGASFDELQREAGYSSQRLETRLRAGLLALVALLVRLHGPETEAVFGKWGRRGVHK